MSIKLIKLAFRAGYESALSAGLAKSAEFGDEFSPRSRRETTDRIIEQSLNTGLASGLAGASLGAILGAITGKKRTWFRKGDKAKKAALYAIFGNSLGNLAGIGGRAYREISRANKVNNRIKQTRSEMFKHNDEPFYRHTPANQKAILEAALSKGPLK